MQAETNVELLRKRKLKTTDEMIQQYHKVGPIGYIPKKIPINFKGTIGWTSKKSNYSNNGSIALFGNPEVIDIETDYTEEFEIIAQFR